MPFTSCTNQRISPEKPKAFPPSAFRGSPPLRLLYLPGRLACVWRLDCFVKVSNICQHNKVTKLTKRSETRCCSTVQMFFHLCELRRFTWESKILECQESTSEEQNLRQLISRSVCSFAFREQIALKRNILSLFLSFCHYLLSNSCRSKTKWLSSVDLWIWLNVLNILWTRNSELKCLPNA